MVLLSSFPAASSHSFWSLLRCFKASQVTVGHLIPTACSGPLSPTICRCQKIASSSGDTWNWSSERKSILFSILPISDQYYRIHQLHEPDCSTLISQPPWTTSTGSLFLNDKSVHSSLLDVWPLTVVWLCTDYLCWWIFPSVRCENCSIGRTLILSRWTKAIC